MVRSLADKTARASKDLTDFSSRFHDRLHALARVQGLLSRLEDADRVAFDELLQVELAAINGHADRIELDGPRGVKLRSSTVQLLALALHELATNAVKYGALSQPRASLSISWRVDVDALNGSSWLCIEWREMDVAIPRDLATETKGQGRDLIERALPYQLGAEVSYTLGHSGVHCLISVPISSANQETGLGE